MPEINGLSLPFLPIGGLEELKRDSSSILSNDSTVSFNDVFSDELNKLKFSAHAQSRLTSRDIELSNNDISRLESAVNKAESKGANESLVLLDNKAFIVSIANKTVITVVNNNDLNDNIITNIDSAVFA